MRRFASRSILGLIVLGIGFLRPAGADAQSALRFYDQGRLAMESENWYDASEAFLESLKINPSHGESMAALGECYYYLGEFDQALSWVRKGRTFARGSMALANLEAFVLIALGRLDAADSVIKEVLSKEPYNREALFASAELDVARGRASDAVGRYREAARRYPDDKRALLSLALVLGSLGDKEGSRTYAARAVLAHPEDPRVHYYAAYLDADAGRLENAARSLETSLRLRPGYSSARSLLASVRYRSNRFEEAARLADEAIAADRSDSAAWYLKGMSYVRMGRSSDGRSIFAAALSMDPADEFLRAALEDLLLSTTPIESPDRIPWADWHFSRARDYLSRNLSDQALFEYRRGLRLNPYALERRNYAELLRLRGYPSRHLEELRFMQDLGKADRAVNDAVESYDSLLYDALHRRWRIDPVQVVSRHWKIAILSITAQSGSVHPDAGAVTASYLRDLLAHEGNIQSVDVELRQPSFSSAFRAAREAGSDYFMIVGVSESGRDLTLKGELYVARTGSPAAAFSSYRTGDERLRNASRGIVEKIVAALPFRAVLIKRNAGLALMDKGKMDGVVLGNTYEIVRKGAMSVKNEGIGLVYAPDDVVGTLVVDGVDEQVSSGVLARKGFFDRIALGDEVMLVPAKGEEGKGGVQDGAAVDPELRSLLRTLR